MGERRLGGACQLGNLLLGVLGIIWLNTRPALCGEVSDYCKWDLFKANCAADEIIVMDTAFYGRMERGPCIETDFGYVGCKIDVLGLSHLKCSGRRTCEFKIPEESFDRLSNCPKDLGRYYAASYNCLKVLSVPSEMCHPQSPTVLNEPSGFIASVLSEETNCGTTDSPWLIQAKPGQRIKVSLIDFGVNNTDHAQTHCHVYMIMKERSVGKSHTVCGGVMYEQHVYLSTSHQLELRVVTGASGRNRYFLIKYEVIGCETLKPPVGGWLKNEGGKFIGGCDNSYVTWSMTCNGTKWRGVPHNCTAGHPGNFGKLSVPYAMSVAIIVGIALLIGLCVLCLGLICLRRRQQRRSDTRQNIDFSGAQRPIMLKEEPYKKASVSMGSYAPPPYASQPESPGENEYAYVEDLIPFPPPPVTNRINQSMCNTPASRQRGYPGSPPSGVPVKHHGGHYEQGTACRACRETGPQYFELDMNGARGPQEGPPKSPLQRPHTQSQPNLAQMFGDGTLLHGLSPCDRSQKETV